MPPLAASERERGVEGPGSILKSTLRDVVAPRQVPRDAPGFARGGMLRVTPGSDSGPVLVSRRWLSAKATHKGAGTERCCSAQDESDLFPRMTGRRDGGEERVQLCDRWSRPDPCRNEARYNPAFARG